MADVFSKESLINSAKYIGNSILKEARHLPDGSLTWDWDTDRNFEPVCDSGLYHGRCGEGLFFGALYKATTDRRFKQASLQTFAALKKNLDNSNCREQLIQRLGLGLAGVGGLIYTLVRTSEFIHEESLVREGRKIAESVGMAHIQEDHVFEIVGGSAGLIPGLIALADAGFEGFLETAEECAKHLLENRAVDPVTKLRVWSPQAKIPMSGFAHGSTGISHTLLQLYKRTGQIQFYEAAIEVFYFERSLYREDVMNWPDFRGQTRFNMCSWCHGATGIGFSRLSALDVIKEVDESHIAQDLMNAINKTNSLPLQKIDNLCCGNFGRIDFLLEAGRKLENKSLKEAAVKKALVRLDELTDKHKLSLPLAYPHKVYLSPGFWKGFAGCGYSLLRLADIHSFPCILMME